MEIRKSVQLFAEEMEKSLRRHDYKPPWEDDEILLSECMKWTIEEAKEVQDAINIYSEIPTKENAEFLMEECGDLGVTALIIFSKVHSIAMNFKRGKKITQN